MRTRRAVGQATTKITVTAKRVQVQALEARASETGHRGLHGREQGQDPHDFKIAGKKTKTLNPGKKATLRVVFKKKGRFAYVCTLPGHARLGMKGVLGVGVTPPKPAPPTTTSDDDDHAAAPADRHRRYGEHDRDRQHVRVPLRPLAGERPLGPGHVRDHEQGPGGPQLGRRRGKAGALLGPGQTETWTVSLPPKGYTGVCDVPFHVERGMTTSVTVTP